MIHRRLFLGGMLAATAAPAIVRAENLMRIVVPAPVEIWVDGWSYEAGKDGFGHDYWPTPWGPRFDRAYIPTIFGTLLDRQQRPVIDLRGPEWRDGLPINGPSTVDEYMPATPQRRRS